MVVTLEYPSDKTDIFRARHDVYAKELRQYPENPAGVLTDATDEYNQYIVMTQNGALVGFVAITPPGHAKAMHKHGVRLDHDALAFEVRLLTTLQRGYGLSMCLMYAALRYIEASGGSHIVCMGREQVVPLYERVGFRKADRPIVRSGHVTYVPMESTCADARNAIGEFVMPSFVQWALPFPAQPYAPCFHGGRGLETLDPTQGIHADVLDAWYPPAPTVLAALKDLEVHVRTTPPGQSVDLLSAISSARGVPKECVLLGAGSSDLIYRCFFAWLTPASRVLLLDPTYAEYSHVLSTIGCQVDLLRASPDKGYALCREDIPDLTGYDMIVLCNPNSPTGVFCPDLADLLGTVPDTTRVWIDETYIDFVNTAASLEQRAATRPNIIVCKSMSKVYALSGARVAYAVGHPAALEGIKLRTPPWIVSRMAHVAAVNALESPEYYARRIAETHALRKELAKALRDMGFRVWDGCANFLMCAPPEATHKRLEDMLEFCRRHGVYLRGVYVDNVAVALRVAVKAVPQMKRILDVVHCALTTAA